MKDILNIVVLTHNPNGDWGDVRPLIEEQGYYKGWNKSITVEIGQTVLIYITGNIRQIQYIMEVTNVYDDSINLKLVKKLSEKQSKLLSFENLKEHGLKKGTINYILDNNKQLYEYVKSVINNETIKEKKDEKMNIKNIILYGAPGVGKTHNYKNIISMIEEGKSQNEIFDVVSKNQHVDLKNNAFEGIKKEGRVEFVTFHQSYSYEDFIEGFRPTEHGNIELEDGIFKRLSLNALNKNKELEFKHISFDEAYDILRSMYFNNELEPLYSVSDIEIVINDFKEKSLKVQSKSAKDEQYVKKNDLEVVVNAILKNLVSKPSDIRRLEVKKDTFSLSGYYFPIANKIVEIIYQNKLETEEQKNFYIVIDEINRGNISKIFGELITLIEEDKRDKYEVTLPYSKEKFKVPSNLYIIATMNSTDKSIATIDIALRRRFTFLKMKPNVDLISHVKAKELFNALNIFIKENLNEDYMLGHSYFMNVVSDDDLEFVKEYKIKPLLEEYFYADEENYAKVVGILSKENSNE
ncbi:MAG: 5-methylcytosine-specific restriction enzyme [Campylobacterota bacterium]|nr:5-methylcytosine-specific restriction enzyme [Campylobacterota bacterium]